ncbi:MAG TPA: hypothetical protein IGS52_05550 [Oscillatoriaceae cyanobacterium M33_DOE_052]|nr:hypothetical protein [Oscillatoriaceae cyanobacterium M33_DOE_052]
MTKDKGQVCVAAALYLALQKITNISSIFSQILLPKVMFCVKSLYDW